MFKNKKYGKYSYYFLVRFERKIFADFWSARDDIALGVNEGWYLGGDVEIYYDALHRHNILRSDLLKWAFPAELGEKTDEEVYGVGMLDMRPLDTCVIEIAEDQKTARGMWYDRGSYSDITEEGPISYWVFGCYAVDFVKEDDGWKIWHMQYLRDVDFPTGSNWTKEPKKFPVIPFFAENCRFDMPQPTICEPLRELYHIDRPFSPWPELPAPYVSFGEMSGYGPEGR